MEVNLICPCTLWKEEIVTNKFFQSQQAVAAISCIWNLTHNTVLDSANAVSTSFVTAIHRSTESSFCKHRLIIPTIQGSFCVLENLETP